MLAVSSRGVYYRDDTDASEVNAFALDRRGTSNGVLHERMVQVGLRKRVSADRSMRQICQPDLVDRLLSK